MKRFASLWRHLTDAVFPEYCLGCRAEGRSICRSCLGTIFYPGIEECPRCHAASASGAPCGSCRRQTPLSGVIAMLRYTEASLAGRLIHAFKYDGVETVGMVFAGAIETYAREHPAFFHGITRIMPVPLHPRRYAERGFNQAGIFAQALGIGSAKRVDEISLRRTRQTLRQVRLTKPEREQNVRGAFACSSPDRLSGERVCLVDDVFTTGSTMEECARVLLQAGAGEVRGFALARGR